MVSPATRNLVLVAGGEALERYGTLWGPRTSPVERITPSFDRDSVGWAYGPDTRFHQVEADTPRVAWKRVNGLWRPTYRAEGPRTVQNTDSMDFSSGSDWAGEANWTITEVTSLFGGQTAYKHESDGGSNRSRAQTVGTLTGAPETFHVKLESVDAAITRWGIYDSTAGGFVVRGQITWSTGEVTIVDQPEGSSVSVYIVEDLGTGPNGGQAYWLAVTGTPNNLGNTRNLFIYPNGGQASVESVILHYAGLEPTAFPSSAIDTNAGSASRADEKLNPVVNVAPLDMTVLIVFPRPVWADLAGVDLGNALGIGAISPLVPRLTFGAAQNSRDVTAKIDTDDTDASATVAIPAGDPIKVLVQFRNLTDQSSGGEVRISVDGVTWTGWQGPATAFQTFGDPKVHIGLSIPINDAFFGHIYSFKIAYGLWGLEDMEAAGATRLFDGLSELSFAELILLPPTITGGGIGPPPWD